MIKQLEPSVRSQDARPAWIEAFLKASHEQAIDNGTNGCRRRVRPHPGAPWIQLRTLAPARD